MNGIGIAVQIHRKFVAVASDERFNAVAYPVAPTDLDGNVSWVFLQNALADPFGRSGSRPDLPFGLARIGVNTKRMENVLSMTRLVTQSRRSKIAMLKILSRKRCPHGN
jgi:hypothetical protein